LKEDFNKVTGWCSTNQLLINPDKTQFILFVVNQLLRHVPLNVELPFLDKILKHAGHVKDLGITLDQSLSYSSHINETVSSCHFNLFQIRRVKHLLDKATLELVIQSLVLSKLLYC
jgi:CHAD domain-containing protein